MTEPTAPNDRAERAFRDGLRQHADEVDFEPLELVTPTRSGGRIPRWLPVAAVVALVAAVAIPLAITQFGGGSSSAVPAPAQAERAPADSGSGSAPHAPGDAPRPGWRWESYRVLSYQVPQYWGYAWSPASDWCAAGRMKAAPGPFVDLAPELRPVAMILCPRELPAGQLQMFVTVRSVTAADRGWDLPAGWTMATSKELAGYVVQVVHTNEFAQVAGQIIESVRPIGAVDPNGCPAVDVIEDGGMPSKVAELDAPDRVSLCQYRPGEAGLVASKLLTGAEGRSVAAALAAAPAGSGPDDTSCEASAPDFARARLWHGETASEVYVRYAGCRGNGIFDGGPSRKLTAEACRAVLQPPLVFTTGHGPAGELCMAPPVTGGEDAPTPSASPTR